MSMNYQSLLLDDFSGGMTDYPFNAPKNKAATLDNFTIDPNKKPIMRPGSVLTQSADPQLPIGEAKINNLLPHDSENIYYVEAGTKFFYPDAGAYTELLGVGGVDGFNAGDESSFSAFSEWNRHWIGVNSDFALPIKIFKDDLGVPQVRTAGLPKMASTPTVTPVSGSNSYIWYFIYKYEYKIGDTTFIDLSTPIFVQKTGAAEPSVGNPAAITAIPVLANAGGTSYDLTKITKQIFRTTNGGKAAFFVAEIPNATTTYSDQTNDLSVVNNEPLYTTGPNGTDGTLAYDAPPLCKYFHVMDGIGLYAYTKEDGDTFPNRLRQSTPGDPDSVPGDFFIDLRDEFTGISSYKGRIIALCKTRIYRLDNIFDETGRGGLTEEEISKVTGCLSHNSIVQTETGVFFAGDSGFYWTDGYEVRKVSDSINTRYKNMLALIGDTRNIQGRYDAFNLKIYWTFKQVDETAENDCIFCFDLRYLKEGQIDGSFTRWLNDGVFNPCAIMVYKNELYRGDFYGFVYRHDDTVFSDPRTDNLVAPANWGTKAIIWDFYSAHLNFDLPSVRKWVAQILFTARNSSNMSIQPYSINDDSAAQDLLKEIRFRDALVWGDPEPTWGDPSLQWNFQGLIEERRRFPQGGLRCSYKQVRFTNAFTIVTGSDAYTTASVDRVTKEATLDDLALSWLPDLLDYYLVLKPNGGPTPDTNDYTLMLPIKSRDSNTVLTLDDPTDILNNDYPAVDGYSFDNAQWLIKGYPKGEAANIMSVVIYYAPLTPSQRTFQGTVSETGKNS